MTGRNGIIANSRLPQRNNLPGFIVDNGLSFQCLQTLDPASTAPLSRPSGRLPRRRFPRCAPAGMPSPAPIMPPTSAASKLQKSPVQSPLTKPPTRAPSPKPAAPKPSAAPTDPNVEPRLPCSEVGQTRYGISACGENSICPGSALIPGPSKLAVYWAQTVCEAKLTSSRRRMCLISNGVTWQPLMSTLLGQPHTCKPRSAAP